MSAVGSEIAAPVAEPQIDRRDRLLLWAIQDGLPLTPRPFETIGDALDLSESEVLARLRRLLASGVVKRFGVVVRHRELGYRANAMIVWDIPDDRVDAVGRRMAACERVRLCYRRPRRLPDWPYNLFCMIHGRDRAGVLAELEEVIHACDLRGVRHEILFSTRCFKQRGARYDVGAQEAAG